MQVQKTLDNFNSIADKWLLTLEKHPFEDLLKKPSEKEWSLGQVYMHVFMAHEMFFIKNAIKCLELKGEKTDKGKNFTAKMIFFFGAIPPIKVRMPESVAIEPPQPENIEQLKLQLENSRKLMQSVAEQLPGFDPSIKAKHPIFGMINALEWFQGAEMHFKHHLNQIQRVEKFLKN